MEQVPAIVIGSGFGGAVAALRLGQAGIPTVVLERGRRWTIEDPTTNATYATFEHPDGRAEWLNSVTKTPAYEGTPIDSYTGILEILTKGNSTFMVGAGVGGGSHVYGGILIQPPGELFRRVFPSAVDYEEMDQTYYPRVLDVIKTESIPDDVLATDYFTGLRTFVEHARKAGFPERESTTEFRSGTARFPMAVDWDAVREEIAGKRVPSFIAAEFWYGNNSGAKRTLDRDYLKLAEDTGSVQIRPHHLVRGIAAVDGGYQVTCARIDETGTILEDLTLRSDHLFLAAGAFGTSELLLRARAKDELPRLSESVGNGFGNDGDIFLIRGDLKEITNPHLGGPGCIALLDYDNPVNPSIMMRAPLPRFAQDYPEKNVIGSFFFSVTSTRGRLYYDEAIDSVELDFTPDGDAAARHLAQRLNAANGGQLLATTANITGHQLGGACMGTTCDTEGRVDGYPGLYVVDGALIPGSSTCTNPAFTIAAVAERCMEHILTTNIGTQLG
ncbi:MAG: GMC oxidoreductase [Pseudonocardiaceae bacterium]